MAAPDCGICADLGYRSCDVCGGVVFDVDQDAPLDLCGGCKADATHP